MITLVQLRQPKNVVKVVFLQWYTVPLYSCTTYTEDRPKKQQHTVFILLINKLDCLRSHTSLATCKQVNDFMISRYNNVLCQENIIQHMYILC